MKDMIAQDIPKTSIELIVYQIGEVKALITNLATRMEQNLEKVESRLTTLEIWKAGEMEKNKSTPKLDAQKIILSAFGITSAAIALSLAIIQSGIIK